MRTHFWPFTRVLTEIAREVTRKVVEAAVLYSQRCQLQKKSFPKEQATRLLPELANHRMTDSGKHSRQKVTKEDPNS
jgi:hypothetical protein